MLLLLSLGFVMGCIFSKTVQEDLAAPKSDVARAVNAKAEALTTAAVSDVLSPG